MFNPTQPLFRSWRRLRLTTKMMNKGFYKGNRTGSMGRHTKHGGFIIEWRKVRTYVCPQDLDDFKLTPFVSKNIETPKAPQLTGQRYLRFWKEEIGSET